jgi:hypothetical protein
VAGFFAAMVKTDYAQKPQFIKNFFDDWRTQFMSKEEKALITDFKKWYVMGARPPVAGQTCFLTMYCASVWQCYMTSRTPRD